MKKTSIIVIAFLLAACGGGGEKPVSKSVNVGRNDGKINMAVFNTKGLSGDQQYAAVAKYRVTVTAPDMDEPVVKEFDGDTESGLIEGLPVGDDRVIGVETINPFDTVIRKGDSGDVSIYSDEVTNVGVELSAVPMFVNVKEGNAIANNRIKFQLFADPEDPLEVNIVTEDNEALLLDASTGMHEVYPDVSSGLADLVPALIEPGKYTFKVASKRTGYSSQVSLQLLDGTKLKPAPLYSGGRINNGNDAAGVSRIGSAFQNNERKDNKSSDNDGRGDL